ncbi:MAG: histidine kinase, partial [Acidobacteria bacterium]|nr:histidine kinase [Acidobacteriota bacterium]
EAWIWAAFTSLIFRLANRLPLDRARWYVRAPLLIAIGLAISVAVFFLLDIARDQIFEDAVRRRPIPAFAPLRDIGRFRFANQLVLYFAVLAVGYAREYFLRDQLRQRESIALRAQLADAQLDALRMQLNPHFLFNTLHAMSALVERDPGGVRRMIARLSELLRHTTDAHAADEVPLREELGFLRRYIEIMEIRFQGRLQVKVDIDESLLDARVPNLILQPIVENALEHGVSRAGGSGEVAITARRDGNRLVLAVRDNGPGLPNEPRAGVGLANTRARLAQLYGAQASLSLQPAEGGGVLAEIVVPHV